MVDSCYCGGFWHLLPVAAVPTAVVAVVVVVVALSRTATVVEAKKNYGTGSRKGPEGGHA
jgi:hypothetical protein